MTKSHVIFEHSKITKNCISESAFEWLTRYILEDEEKQPPFIKHYGDRLQVKNYVGIIETPCGTCIEVLPKIYKNETEEEQRKSKQLLWKMLSVVYDLKSLEATETNLEKRSGRLVDVLISNFLKIVSSIVHRGLRSDYVRIQAERHFIKGRLRVNQQLRQPLSKQHKFQIEYDCFLPNRPENRLLKTALQKVLKWTLDSDNQRYIRQLLLHFDDIPISTQAKQDLINWSTQRDMVYYQTAKPWVELIITEQTPWFNKGSWQGISLLFPMEKLFEKYVAKQLKKQLVNNFELKTQLNNKYLVKHKTKQKEKPLFQLKPDLAIQRRQDNKLLLILDTKWKLLDTNGEKYDLNQHDFYQLFAYGHKYLEGKGDLVLIYPKTERFQKPLSPFYYSEALILWVVPFCLENNKLILDNTPLISYFQPTDD
jgi:5-methylcytosine-specific restriction enzyme subunit McrC